MKLSPTALILPLLAALLCLDLPADDVGPAIVALPPTPEPVHRLPEEEIEQLLRSAEKRFGVARPAPAPVPLPERDMELRCHNEHVDVRCSYPRTGLKPLRAHVKKVFSEAAEIFRGYVADFEDTSIATFPWEYVEEWYLRSRTARMASLSCTGWYYCGGAHPNTFHRSATFLVEGEEAVEVRLADLFNPCALWQGELSERVLAQLRAAEASLVASGEIRFLDERRLECWSLTPEGIEFDFPPYDVGCYAEGSFSVLIRYDDLRPLLSPLGPTAEFLR